MYCTCYWKDVLRYWKDVLYVILKRCTVRDIEKMYYSTEKMYCTWYWKDVLYVILKRSVVRAIEKMYCRWYWKDVLYVILKRCNVESGMIIVVWLNFFGKKSMTETNWWMKQIVIYDVVCNACVQSVRTNINTWIKSTFFFVFPSFLGRHFSYRGDVTEDRRLIIVCLIFWKKMKCRTHSTVFWSNMRMQL